MEREKAKNMTMREEARYLHFAREHLEQKVSIHSLMRAAAGLRSEDHENPEYDRALVELISEFINSDGDVTKVVKLDIDVIFDLQHGRGR